MFNFDAFGSLLGWTYLVCNGAEGAAPYFARRLEAAGHFARVSTDLIPYADHFPFVAAGVPAAWIGRNNCAAGRFFHHRPDDTLARVSCPLVAEITTAIGGAIADLASAETLPFPGAIDPAVRAGVDGLWEGLFGGWTGFSPC
jgi:Zn-dependent M28 family amino/carboxypeptidase